VTPSFRASAAAALIALALAASACGSDDDDDGASDQGKTTTALTVTLDSDGPGGQDAVDATVSCPGEEAACAAASELSASDADPVSPDTPCTKIYGGPDVVTLAGTIGGEQVDAELTREDGCEIERFGSFEPLLEALFDDYQAGAELKP
jgi:hypothetical protein